VTDVSQTPEGGEEGRGGGLRGRLRRFAPAAFFLGGFLWDALTLGRSVKTLDLFLLLGYLIAAAVILTLIGRGASFRGSRFLNPVLQFFFGGMLSALLIFYFLSASGLAALLFVAFLAGLLIANEFLESAYSELTMSWAFFTLCAAMFFNFALAHLFRSISAFWFYLGSVIAALVVVMLRQWSLRERASLVPSMVLVAAMLALHALNVIPPVPLVKKEMLVAHAMRKTEGGYAATVESPGWRFWRSSGIVFHRAKGERVYCFTSVFVPEGITTTIRHRWEWLDPVRHEWVAMGVVPFTIAGGRTTGYRGFTYKSNARPGRWRVIAESESGAAIGIIGFEVAAGTPERPRPIRL
jgi:hypothetical protein